MSPFASEPGVSAPDELRSAWRATVYRTVLPGLLTIILFVTVIFTVALPALRNGLMQSKRNTARELTSTAWSVLDSYAKQVPQQLTLEEAQKRAIAQLRELRYGPEGLDYFWVNDLQPVMIMHPYRTELEGTNIAEFRDVEGKALFLEMVEVVETDGEGFVEYMWWWKDSDRIEPKLSFVQGFEPWGWIVGTGIYIEDVQAEIAVLRRRLLLASLVILAIVVVTIAFMVWQARITERRRLRAEASLRESERKFRGIFHSSYQFTGLVDFDGVLIEINNHALERIGQGAEQVCGRPLVETHWFTQHPLGAERLQEALNACRDGDGGRFEVDFFDADYERILMEFSVRPIRDRYGRLAHIVVEGWDITEMSELQEQLRQSQKMEAIGQLAGGVAHDFNNILMGIMGHAELLLEEAQPGTRQAEALRLIINASMRAGDLTRQLLSFSRKGKLETRPVDVHRVVQEVVSLLERSIDRRIRIDLRLDAAQHTVDGDPSMLQNAVLNLAVNARDAMDGQKIAPDRPRILTFTTRLVELDEAERAELCRRHRALAAAAEAPQGPCLELTVRDTGCGIDAKLQKLVFEPFFTTKDPGEGTGLGLAGVLGCVQSHGGAIDLESRLGEGTVFRILLPLSAETEGDEIVAAPAAHRGTGHVLLVDDEEILRNFAKVALGRLGYRVTTCADGIEALDYFETHHDKIDLVILDLIMNRMGGEETFRRMRQIDPEVKVLISSGFSRDNVINELVADGARGFLSKPYKLSEMSREVARVIGVRDGDDGRTDRAGRAT